MHFFSYFGFSQSQALRQELGFKAFIWKMISRNTIEEVSIEKKWDGEETDANRKAFI